MRAANRWKRFFRIALTLPNPSSACFSASNTARSKASNLRACWRISSKWPIRPGKKRAKYFLHEELEYVVVSGWQEAERGVEFLRAESDGRATFLVHPEASAASPLAPDLSATLGRGRPAARHAAPDQWIRAGSARLAAAPGALFPGLRSRRRAGASPRQSGLLFSAAGWRQLSRPRGQRRAKRPPAVRWR